MLCKHPFVRNPQGQIKWSIKLEPEQLLEMTPFPCGVCLPCRINKSRIWQHRILLETGCHAESSFVTLTYDELFAPRNSEGQTILTKKHLQKFVRKLRKELYKYDRKFRYFAVGEYGDNNSRAHYHICLFGVGRRDEKSIRKAWTQNGESIGFIHIGAIEKASAGYIAGYTVKKLTSEKDPRLEGRPPEFMLSSRREGGIGIGEVRRIARKLRKNPHVDSEQLFKSFTIGGKKYPLGGYLTKILLDEMGVSDETRRKELLNYQFKIMVDISDDPDSHWYLDLCKKNAGKIKEIETRKKALYQKRRQKLNAKLQQF